MMDEATDASHNEQMSLSVRSVTIFTKLIHPQPHSTAKDLSRNNLFGNKSNQMFAANQSVLRSGLFE